MNTYDGTTDPVITFLEAYEGNNSFLLSVQRAHANWGLSDKQYNAVSKFVANQGRPEASSGIRFDSLLPGTTYHAVENADGSLAFYRIDRVTATEAKPSKWDGWTFVKQVIGGGRSGGEGSQEKRGSARPDSDYRGQHEPQMTRIVEDPTASMLRYGQEVGRCGHCNRLLTDEASRERGIGPVCIQHLG